MIGIWNYGTGRRKSSVARVFIKKGTGQIIVNGKAVDEYFGRQTSIMVVRQPLVLTSNDSAFDVKVNVHGGGESATTTVTDASWRRSFPRCVRFVGGRLMSECCGWMGQF